MTIHFGDSTSIDSGGSLGKILQVKHTFKVDGTSHAGGGTQLLSMIFLECRLLLHQVVHQIKY